MNVVRPAIFAISVLMSLGASALTVRSALDAHHVWEPGTFLLEETPQAANPFDPDSISIDMAFTAPSGKVTELPAFWHQDFARAEVDGAERLTAQGAPGWRVRFTPVEPGVHAYAARVTVEGRGVAEAAGTFTVDAKRDGKGFVRAASDGRYFVLDDGTPYPLLGLNMCWYGARGTGDYEEWLPAYAKAGVNYTRLWMWPHAFGIEVRPGERLNYNLEHAWRLDRVLELARAQGIRVMLCLDYHGIFQVEPDDWGGNNEWPRHPYNVANGGPCKEQNAFFTDEAARALYKKRLRYLVARYAAEPAVMAWQFFNEINNVHRYLKRDDVAAWHGEMGTWLHEHDPYRHLTTTSHSWFMEAPELWSLPGLDYVQCHMYLNSEKADAIKQISTMPEAFRARFGKPVYVGEYGVSSRGYGSEDDPHRRGLRQGLWAGIMSGTAGSVMPWWWEQIHAEKLHGMWSGLAAFIQGMDVGPGWKPMAAAVPEDVRALALSDGKRALLWAVDDRYAYAKGAREEATPHAGGVVTLQGLPDGTYAVSWRDTERGDVVTETDAKCTGGNLEVALPEFSVDIAARVLAK